MDLVFGSAKSYGASRSIVRRIASSLPFNPCPRVHFQLYPYSEDAGVLIAARRQNGLVASLADVAWIDEEDEDSFSGPRSVIPRGLVFRACRPHLQRQPLTRQRSLPSLHPGTPDPQGPTTVNDEAIQKIGALETELAKLKSQIALIVLAQEKNSQPAATTGIPPPPPCGTLPPPPPPPPPPPLPPPFSLQRTFSVIDLIKERRGLKTDSQKVLDSKSAEIPSMLDVLKDMSKIKLRSVKSRPVDGEAKGKSSEPLDAATLIAEALKRKFAHRYRHDSEQGDQEDFKLPVPQVKPPTETPLFGQHMLKSTGEKGVALII